VIQPLTESEKKDKLQELKMRMAEKRALREEAEKKDRKQAEMIRRKAGQDMTAVKEEMEAKEIKKAFDMKKREKEQEKIAKAKIKAQIEQDKKERAAKVNIGANVNNSFGLNGVDLSFLESCCD
jgi:hypothetical protein